MLKKFALLATLIVSTQAQAFDLAVVGVMNNANPEYSATLGSLTGTGTTDGKSAFGFGAIVGWDLMPTLGAEIAVLSVQRKYRSILGSDVSLGGYHAHLAARFGLIDWLTIGVGPAVHFGGSDGDYGSFEKFDIGAFGSVQARLPLAPTISILGDVRYVLGFSDVDPGTSTSFKHRDLMVLLGLNFGI